MFELLKVLRMLAIASLWAWVSIWVLHLSMMFVMPVAALIGALLALWDTK